MSLIELHPEFSGVVRELKRIATVAETWLAFTTGIRVGEAVLSPQKGEEPAVLYHDEEAEMEAELRDFAHGRQREGVIGGEDV